MKNLIINFFVSLLLFCFAVLPTIVLTFAVIPFSFIYYVIRLKWKSGIEQFSKHLHGAALSADQFACKTLAPLLNVSMVKNKTKEIYENGGAAEEWMLFMPFGDEDDTLSYCIAVNYMDGTLSKFGMFWAKLLLFVDYKAKREGTNHLVKAIENKRLRDVEAYERLKRQGFLATV